MALNSMGGRVCVAAACKKPGGLGVGGGGDGGAPGGAQKPSQSSTYSTLSAPAPGLVVVTNSYVLSGAAGSST